MSLRAVAHQVTAREPDFHGSRDLARKFHARAGGGLKIERCIPRLDFLLFFGFDHVPHLDDAGRRVAHRFMQRRHGMECQALEGAFSGKDPVDGLQHCRH
jgi:hypothetical protein